MVWPHEFGTWLLHSAVFGAIILCVGGCAVCLCREPLYRTRIIHWTFVACLLVPLLQQVDAIPSYSLDIWREVSNPQSSHPASALKSPPAAAQLNSFDVAGDTDEFVRYRSEKAHASPAHQPDGAGFAGASIPRAEVSAPKKYRLPPLPSAVQALQAAYVALVAYWLLTWLVGLLCRSLIARRATPADQPVRNVLVSIAGPRAQHARLLVSDRIDSPVMWGLWRPTIVVPSRLATTPDSAQLRWGLAHEWSHVQHDDFSTLLLARLAKLVCFYQPAYWWLRRQLTLSQDYLADAFAAAQGGSAEDYAAFLVSLARSRRQSMLADTLGIGGHRSNLLRRVKMLVQTTRPLVQHDRRLPALSIALFALLLVGGLSVMRLSAEPVVDKSSAGSPAEKEKAATSPPAENKPALQDAADARQAKDLPEPITYTGRVVDRETGAPIAGATVEVTHEFSRDPQSGEWRTLYTTTHMSDEKGQYSFTLPPEEVAEPSLYLVVDAHHPEYQSKGRSGYSHAMIRTNLAHGEPPFYATIKLSPGELITGIVQQPDGTPAAHTRILVYSKAPAAEPGRSFELGAFQDSQTDENGRFRVVVPTPGDGVLWVYPKEFSPLAHRIGDQRGDMGSLKLQEGVRLSGQVLDAKGQPVPNVAVNVRRNGDGEEADEFLGPNAVANGIRAGTKTDEEGRFQLNPLPPGTYRGEVEEHVGDPTEGSERREELAVNHVFVPLEITINQGEPREPIEIRAVPHVVVRGRFFNSQGEPRASHAQHLFGKVNGKFIFAQSTRPQDDGWFEFKVPHGVEDVRINLTTNEHSALRWRRSPDEPLVHGRELTLGKLEEDFTTLEVVRYKAPILLVKAVDENGQQIGGFKPKTEYKTRPAADMQGRFVSGSLGDVNFEQQPDDRWRSNQLLPDEEITVTLEKEGYTTEPQVVTLEEGEVRELVFVLKENE